MVQISFVEPGTSAWNRWKTRCQDEQARHNRTIQAGRKSKVKKDLYKAQSAVYLDPTGPFHGKCVYCEEDIFRNQTGDIEHFRPIAKVEDETGRAIRIRVRGRGRDHPGYYWLAYDWRNLLASCILCNRPSKKHSGGRLIGKRNLFPVRRFRATRAGEEVRENSLLINPVRENPADHLELDDLGVYHGRTEKGETCIRIFGLNDRDLPNGRRRKYEDVKEKMSLLIRAMAFDPNGQEARRILTRILGIKKGIEEHSAVGRKAIRDLLQNVEPLFQTLLDGE